jgi:hypothetical protein
VRTLLGHLVLASQGTLEQVPLLEDLVGADGRPLFLTAAQERQLRSLMPAGSANLRPAQKLVLALPGNGSPELEAEEQVSPPTLPPGEEGLSEGARPVPPLSLPEEDLHLIPPGAIQVLDQEPEQPMSRLERWLHLAVAAAAVFLAVALTLIVLRLGTRPPLRERLTPPLSPPRLEAPAIEASRQPPLHHPQFRGEMQRE